MNNSSEEHIDKILIYMLNELEFKGLPINGARFDFTNEINGNGDIETINVPIECFSKSLNICLTRNLINQTSIGSRYTSLSLTQEGYGRALSAKLGKNRSYELGATMQIQNLTIAGNGQVGNGNVQNIGDILLHMKQEITNSDAPAKEKSEALGLLEKLSQNALIASTFGSLAGNLTNLLK